MQTPITDTTALTRLLGRTVLAVETETAMGMERVVALELDGARRFPLPFGNGLRSAGEVAEVGALLAGHSRRVGEALRRRVGPADPETASAEIEAALQAALEDPDGILDVDGQPPGSG